jgi:hypothetical protein
MEIIESVVADAPLAPKQVVFLEKDDPATEPTILQNMEGRDVDALIASIASLLDDFWRHGRERRIVLGRELQKLYDLLARRGNGTFMQTVTTRLKIPYSTATDYMKEAAASCDDSRNNSISEELCGVVEPDAEAEEVEAAKSEGRATFKSCRRTTASLVSAALISLRTPKNARITSRPG